MDLIISTLDSVDVHCLGAVIVGFKRHTHSHLFELSFRLMNVVSVNFTVLPFASGIAILKKR